MTRLSRRRFVALTAAASAATALPFRVRGAAPAGERLLRELLGDLAAARALGRTYLASGVDGGAALRRAAALVDGARSTTELRARLRTLADAELGSGEVALVEGWVLARSEAELMALAAASANA